MCWSWLNCLSLFFNQFLVFPHFWALIVFAAFSFIFLFTLNLFCTFLWVFWGLRAEHNIYLSTLDCLSCTPKLPAFIFMSNVLHFTRWPTDLQADYKRWLTFSGWTRGYHVKSGLLNGSTQMIQCQCKSKPLHKRGGGIYDVISGY